MLSSIATRTLARSVLASDDAVDSLRTACYHELTSSWRRTPSNIQQALNLMVVIRNLERNCRPLHQHRRRRAVPGEGNRRPAITPKPARRQWADCRRVRRFEILRLSRRYVP